MKIILFSKSINENKKFVNDLKQYIIYNYDKYD